MPYYDINIYFAILYYKCAYIIFLEEKSLDKLVVNMDYT